MLRDNFFTRIWHDAMNQGATVHQTVTNDPDTPDMTTIEQDGQVRDTLTSVTPTADPYGLERSNNITFDDILREHDNLQRQLRNSGNLAYYPYGYTYTTQAPDYTEMQAKLEKLQNAVADMIVRRELAFKEHGSSADEKIVDYGYKLVDIFKELFPDQYATAMGSAEIRKRDSISTDN